MLSITLKFSIAILAFALKVIYPAIIYHKCNCDNKKIKNVLTYLSIPFPIITGIVFCLKYSKRKKDSLAVLILLFTVIFSLVLTGYAYSKTDTLIVQSDMIFKDSEGNSYEFDFDKTGYDYLYKESSNESLNADLCYIDKNNVLYYDKNITITAENENQCTDKKGNVYYPVKHVTYHRDGTIKCTLNSSNFSYDRLGKAYTYENVPYYDKEGNKYLYSFDSKSQKGYYTNISTQKAYENEYSFVDEDGYFVYDEEHSFERQENIENVQTYKDSSGKIYYWASNISWDKDGNLLDIYGKTIK